MDPKWKKRKTKQATKPNETEPPMCYTLSAEKILLNYFANSPESDRISFSEIEVLSCKIVRECKNSIVTKTSAEDIMDAVNQRKPTLQLEDATVILKDRENSLLRNIRMLNRAMPELVKEKCEEICRDYALR